MSGTHGRGVTEAMYGYHWSRCNRGQYGYPPPRCALPGYTSVVPSRRHRCYACRQSCGAEEPSRHGRAGTARSGLAYGTTSPFS